MGNGINDCVRSFHVRHEICDQTGIDSRYGIHHRAAYLRNPNSPQLHWWSADAAGLRLLAEIPERRMVDSGNRIRIILQRPDPPFPGPLADLRIATIRPCLSDARCDPSVESRRITGFLSVGTDDGPGRLARRCRLNAP